MKEKFVVTILSQISINIITLTSIYFLILSIDAALFGIWVFMNSVINIGFLFFDLGLTSIHYQYSEKNNFDEYFSSFLVIKFFLICINLVASLILITFLNLWNSTYLFLLILILISKVITDMLNIFIIHLKAKIKVFKVEIAIFISSLGQNLAILYIAFNINSIAEPLIFLSISIIFFNAIHVIFIFIFSKNEFKITKPSKFYIFNYLNDTKPLMIFAVLSVIIANFGNILLDYSFDHETLAYFSIVAGYILPFFKVISTSLIGICTPLFSQYLANGEKQYVQITLHLIEKYFSIFILFIILNVYLIGDLIFSVFLPSYKNSLPVLYILIIIIYFEAIDRNYGVILISGKKQKLSASLSTFNVTLKLILLILLIPKDFFNFKMLSLGSLGYSLALLIPMIIGSFYIRYFVKTKFNINPQFQILLHISLAISTFLIVNSLKIFILEGLIENQILLIITLVILSLGIYLVELFVFKILNKNDIKTFIELFKFKNYKMLFKEEFS